MSTIPTILAPVLLEDFDTGWVTKDSGLPFQVFAGLALRSATLTVLGMD